MEMGPIHRSRLLCALMTAVALLLSACERGSPDKASTAKPGAQLVLKNAAIVTLDPQQPQVAAMAVDGGRIVYLGAEDGLGAFVGPNTRIEDLGGRLVLPGFVGATLPAWALGNRVSLHGAASVGDCQQRVAEFMHLHPQRQVFVGEGWQSGIFAAGGPHKDQLDQVSDFYPIVLFSADRKSVWTNSEALAAAGINSDTADPDGGSIARDDSGLAIGVLRGTGAVMLMRNMLPRRSVEDYRAELRALLAGAGRRAADDGSLVVGGAADFAVLDKNLLQLPVAQSASASLWRRYRAGEVVAGAK
ncbi:amidohydrolase family protein [Microbulbifer sp. SAOS-129_SWC]|uniref:amidohydrolase family protein n=1 Tax=Microbulbifer sp. SAOS-129_SWC TaxID=3145235 RepID=UPI003217F81C